MSSHPAPNLGGDAWLGEYGARRRDRWRHHGRGAARRRRRRLRRAGDRDGVLAQHQGHTGADRNGPRRAERARDLQARARPASCSSAPRRCAPSRRRSTCTAPSATEATGSGFVLDDEGLILTNAHVVAGGDRDRGDVLRRATPSPPRPLGKDPDTDLALLRVDPDGLDLRPLELGDSGTVAGRRPDGRDRQPVRARADADDRRRLGAAAPPDRAERLHDRERDPDRRRAQPRQLRRPAARRARARDRHQLADRERRRIGGSVGIGFAVPVNTAKEVIPQLEERRPRRARLPGRSRARARRRRRRWSSVSSRARPRMPPGVRDARPARRGSTADRAVDGGRLGGPRAPRARRRGRGRAETGGQRRRSSDAGRPARGAAGRVAARLRSQA